MSIATRTPDDVRPTDPDADLVEALRRRDERALMTLVRRHSPTMLRVARGYVGPERPCGTTAAREPSRRAQRGLVHLNNADVVSIARLRVGLRRRQPARPRV